MEFKPKFKMTRERNWRQTLHRLAPNSTTLDKSGRWTEKELGMKRGEKKIRGMRHDTEALVRSTAPRTARTVPWRRTR